MFLLLSLCGVLVFSILTGGHGLINAEVSVGFSFVFSLHGFMERLGDRREAIPAFGCKKDQRLGEMAIPVV